MNKTSVVAVLLSAVLLAGCGAVKVRRILGDPLRYQGKQVSVQGTVTQSTGALLAGTYVVDDGTGTLRVISNRPVPPKGTPVKVKGTIQTTGITIAGRNIGTVLQEQDRDVK